MEEKKVGRCIFMESAGIHKDFKCICKFCFKIWSIYGSTDLLKLSNEQKIFMLFFQIFFVLEIFYIFKSMSKF